MDRTFQWGAWALALTCGTVPVPLAAQTVYRCGNSYGQAPCPGGSAVDVSDVRTPMQKAQADATARQTAATALRMQKERQSEERALDRARADQAQARTHAAPRPAKAEAPSPSAHGKKKAAKAAPDLFTAAVPADDGLTPDKSAKAPAKPIKAP